MNSIGETLRRERQRLNLDLEQVARETKINRRLLEAIEAEDFDRLPGGVFTRSFVRQYARVLGLDEDEIAAELQRNIQPQEAEQEGPTRLPAETAIELPRVPEFASAKPRSGSSLPALAGVVAVMLICSAIYAWWQRGPRTAPPPASTAERSEAPAPVPAPVAAAAQPAAAQPAAAQPAAAAPAPETPAALPLVPDAAASPDAGVRLVLTATEPTWISVRSDGKFVYSGTLQANETRNLDANEQVRMTVGNAGGLSITLNGQPVPPLGSSGQVREVQFSSGGVQIVPRNPPASSPDAL